MSNEASKTAAQKRVDGIRVFRTELETVEREGALTLSEDQRKGLREYHDRILESLASQFDVDTTHRQKQMSWGMRIVSTLGALALAIAVYLFFYRFWGLMTTPVQIAVLLSAPLLAVAAMEWCSRHERTLYFTGLLGLVAFGCFVLNIIVLGTVFNITPSQNALLVWGVFGVLLAYLYGIRIILGAGVLALMGYLTTTLGFWTGSYWLHRLERPENYLIAGLVAFLVPIVIPHRTLERFPSIYRLLGSLATFVAILVLGSWGAGSYLPLTADGVEIVYQLVGFLVAGLAIWIGIRKDWRETTYLGSTFFVIYLYVKFFDWWWELMPKYLFFLVLGAVAVAMLVILKKARSLISREVSS